MFLFLRFHFGNLRFLIGVLRASPILVLHRLGFVSTEWAKIHFLSIFFNGRNARSLRNAAWQFNQEALPSILRSDALSCVQKHLDHGHRSSSLVLRWIYGLNAGHAKWVLSSFVLNSKSMMGILLVGL